MIPPMNFMQCYWSQAHWGPEGIPDNWRSPILTEPPGYVMPGVLGLDASDFVVDYVTGKWFTLAPAGLITFLRQVDCLDFGEASALYGFDFYSWGEFELEMGLLAIECRVPSWEYLPAHWLTVLSVGLYPKLDRHRKKRIIGLPVIRRPNVRKREIPDFLRDHYERTFG